MHMPKHFPRIPLFRIWYSTTYTVLFFAILFLLAVTPTDHIYQSIRAQEIENIFVVSGVYLLTVLVTIFIYSSRLYTNRTVLTTIPKSYLPIEPGEVGKSVRREIVKALERSAIVAWDSRPRDIRKELKQQDDGGELTRVSTGERNHRFRKSRNQCPGTVIPINPASPPWGHVAHPGWSAPDNEDHPSLHFWDVIPELPNLIEAKAVSLAPPDHAFAYYPEAQREDVEPPPDAAIVGLLQRPATMGLRDYLSRLSSFGLINPPSIGAKFLAQYEQARFANAPLSEAQFNALMASFAEILGGMTEVDPAVLAQLEAQEYGGSDASSIARSHLSGISSSSDGSQIHHRNLTPGPSVGMSPFPRTPSPYSIGQRDGRSVSRHTPIPSPGPSFTRTRGPDPETASSPSASIASGSVIRKPSYQSIGSLRRSSALQPQRSTTSLSSVHITPLRPQRSSTSLESTGSGGSVIRLHPNPSEGELPYIINGG